MTDRVSPQPLTGIRRRGYAPNLPLSADELHGLQKLSTLATLRAVTVDWALILVSSMGSWIAFSRFGAGVGTVAIYIVSLVIIGSRQKGLENLTHEGMHFHLSNNRKVNEWLTKWLCGVWIAPAFDAPSQRVTHVGNHHGHFGEPDRDVEFHGYQRLGLGRLPDQSFSRSLTILLGAFLKKTWWRLHADYLSSPRRLAVIAAGAVVMYFLGVLHLFVLYWIVPYFLVYLPIRYISEVSEHMGLAFDSEFTTSRNKLGWFQEWIMQPHGDGYHLVHHLYPGIPHQNLRTAHRLLMRDDVYRTQGHHTFSLVFPRNGRPSTLGELLVAGR